MTLPARIHALPLHLANQIAAGEVVERPASVIKELVENSLDAGATEIYVAVEGAGSQLILVRDNGEGIHPDDLPLAISRHATSKLQSTADLNHIASLGFRGEALPSIQSVSNFSLASRQQDSSVGWKILGNQTDVTPIAQPVGTQVEVRDLFFNIPARRRFLRSARTEQQQILTTLHRLALSRFDVSWRCDINGQTKLQLPIASNLAEKQQRLAKLCGQGFVRQAVWLTHSLDAMQLEGWICQPQAHRPQTDVQYFFINGRVIRDRLIHHAIRQAYGDLIPASRQVAYVLYLTLPLDRVDVNVHPTKHEVRFREARLIHGMISRAVLDAIETARPSHSSEQYNAASAIAENKAQYQPKDLAAAAVVPQVSEQGLSHSYRSAAFQLLGVAEQRFAFVHANQSVWLIDLPAAQAETKKQAFATAVYADNLAIRPILVPLLFPANGTEKKALQQHHDLLKQLGLGFEEKPTGVVLKHLPSLLIEVDKALLVRQLLEVLCSQTVSQQTLLFVMEKLLSTQTFFNIETALSLLKQLEATDWPQKSWACLLDQATLGSLFSAE